MKKGFEDDDMKQQSLAYMKTKNFMAKRIFEQQTEIETLKEQLITQNIKYMQLWDAYKLLSLKCDHNKDNFNLSGCELANSLVLDEKEKDNHFLVGNTEFNPDSIFEDKKQQDKLFSQLKTENLELTKELENLKLDNNYKELTIGKLTSDRVLLFNELSELVLSLKNVNLEVLNKLYKETVKTKTVTSCLGIKMNLLSSLSQLSMISMTSGNTDINVNSCIHVITKFEEELAKIL
jgi:hypothetical protein